MSDLSEELKNLTIMSMEQDAIAKKMFASQESLHEDIVDFIDENPLNRLKTVDDINAFIKRIASIIPSGYAGLILRIITVKIPTRNPKIQRPVSV